MGNENILTEEQYTQLLKERGISKLLEHQKFVSCDGTISFGGMSYTYGKDFFLGDLVTVYSKELNFAADLKIVSVTKTITEGVEYLDIGFGYSRMSKYRFGGLENG